MIALPVLGVTAADVVIQTSEVERRRGDRPPDRDRPTPWSPSSRGISARRADGRPRRPVAGAGAAARRGRRRRPADGRRGRCWAATSTRSSCAHGEAGSRTDAGLGRRRGHRDRPAPTRPDRRPLPDRPGPAAPAAPDEVVVNGALADRGFALGDAARARRAAEPTRRWSASARTPPTAATRSPSAPPGAFDLRRPRAAAPGWSTPAATSPGTTSARSTTIGALVLSRAVLLDPPPASESRTRSRADRRHRRRRWSP